MDTGFEERGRVAWKAVLGLGLVAPVLAGVALLPSGASGGVPASPHDHRSPAS